MSGDEQRVQMSTEDPGEAGRVAWITVDNSSKLNSLTTALLDKLIVALEALSNDDELRCMVLTGAGQKAFVGGANLDELAGLTPTSARAFITRVHKVCEAMRTLPVPVIARINGYCLGAGLELAASADLRIAANNAVFGMPEVRVGLPSVIEAALLPRLVGWGKAREIVYLARNYSASDALAMGLVERVAAPAAVSVRRPGDFTD